MKDESPKAQLIQKIKAVNNILVTVSRNPSVDQLVSALALAMALNKLGKRSVAVFSGQIPAEIHFLDPEKVFESNADSLRDFIISISVDKADRMQVKPEGDFVKVYITPYRTTITPDDLRFEDGDFNIELIIAIGVASRDELDASIASHGKIFHNAVTATMNLSKLNDALGTISWQDERLGCYSEMCYSLAVGLAGNDKSLIDSSVATAFLTGVVSATDQFRNSVTTPAIMSLSAELMAKGANQQLVTSELESAKEKQKDEAAEAEEEEDHSISFSRDQADRQTKPTGPHPVEAETVVSHSDSAGGESNPYAGYVEPASPAPTESSPSGNQPGPAVNNSQPELVVPERAASATPIDRPEPQPIPPTPTIEPVVQDRSSESQPYLEDPNSQVTGLPTIADGASLQKDSGSYLVDDIDGVRDSRAHDDLPFNQPNQVSPIPPVGAMSNPNPTAMPTQPPMPSAMDAATPTPETMPPAPANLTQTPSTMGLPPAPMGQQMTDGLPENNPQPGAASLPPLPPTPTAGLDTTNLPPASPAVPPAPEQPTPAPQPAAPGQTANPPDPGQFVIPS
ncbi:DHH family phosphoesterase [Candidatus Nanoperiomorbus periodonticus]|uniref:DHH family phosphoesterase n=1 Tax=Candidatus Nanoperiomorbus periodonticus TaxID=2171989 RepID=UPI00101C7CD1|nr:hypothetical protein [Candidatus Nanoperiomorbus periodonticus]RYC76313.1 hypothetical protein G51EAM_00278 [Candidatus Nanoperiomorbus periodonticus]